MIGPTFADELKAAGLFGLPFSWGADGSFQFGDMNQAQIDAVMAVYATHNPDKPLVPSQVTKRQATQALILADKIDAVESALASMQGKAGRLARAEWEESQIVERHRPLTNQLGNAIGLSPADVDQLFILAATL